MNEEELRAIEARANAATVGPWEIEYRVEYSLPITIISDDSYVAGTHDGAYANAAFIAAARADVPAWVDEVERLRAELAAVRIASQAYKALAAICPECGGSGEVDSGGFTPWGVGINETCPVCKGSGKAYNDADGAE